MTVLPRFLEFTDCEVRADEGKVEQFSHQKYDQKQRIVPLPKMGAPVSKRYDAISTEYFTRKSIK